MRLHLKSKTKPITITLFLPVEDGFRFAPATLDGEWPGARAQWDGEHWGALDWEEDNGLFINWTDGDTTGVDIRPGLELYAGRIFRFDSMQFGTVEELVVESADLV
jgi:hypothetical protein